MAKIVISYRRTDSDATGRIFDRLVQAYGRHSIFRDIDSTPVGADFRTVIGNALQGADVLIAVVGPNWRGVNQDGSIRLNDVNDLVRIEVETALHRGIPVIPLLVGNAAMPKPNELPDTLGKFAYCHAANIDSGRNFDADIDRLIRSLSPLVKVHPRSTASHPGAPTWLSDIRPVVPRAMIVLGLGTFAVNWLLHQLQGGQDNWPTIANSIASLGVMISILGFLQYVKETLDRSSATRGNRTILTQLVGLFLIIGVIPTVWTSINLNLEDVYWLLYSIATLYIGYRVASSNDWSRYVAVLILCVEIYMSGLPQFTVNLAQGETIAWYMRLVSATESLIPWLIQIAAIGAILLPPEMQEKVTSRFGWGCFIAATVVRPLIGLVQLIQQSKEEYHPDWLADLIIVGLQIVLLIYAYQWFVGLSRATASKATA
jgi:hypothetical protein